MKLILAIVQDEDAGALIEALVAKQFAVTRINTVGGFLRKGNVLVMSGVDDWRTGDFLLTISQNCTTRTQYINPLPPIMEPGEFYMPYPVEVQVGGATVFVLDVERFVRL
jgi:uncharacterized protein YaaQ